MEAARKISIYEVSTTFRRPQTYDSVNARGMVISWEMEMPIGDNSGLLFNEGDTLIVFRSEGNVGGPAVHCRTFGRDPADKIESPSDDMIRQLIESGLIRQLQ